MEIENKSIREDVTSLELVGGPEPLQVQLRDYDPQWASEYLAHRANILRALAGQDVDVEHIGSTSVPGLPAKPIIDIVLVVTDITAEENYLEQLVAAGYELRTREPGHRLVRTPGRDVHVHIYERGAVAVSEYLLLRDHLRSDAEDRALYAEVKQSLMTRQWDDSNDYAAAKSNVIAAIKDRARAARA